MGKETELLRMIIKRSRISRLDGVFIFLLEDLRSILLRAPGRFSQFFLSYEYSKTEIRQVTRYY